MGVSAPGSRWPSRKDQPKIPRSRNTRSPGSQSPLCSCRSHAACPPESPWLFLPAFLVASLPAFLVASFPGLGPAGYFYLLGCRRQGGLLQGCGLLVWELPASVSPWRMQGLFGREKEYKILSSSLVSKAKQHVRGKYSTAERVLSCA